MSRFGDWMGICSVNASGQPISGDPELLRLGGNSTVTFRNRFNAFRNSSKIFVELMYLEAS